MKYILGIVWLLGLSACSMTPSKNANTIRIIKVEPKKYVYEQKYKSKIEQVEYTDVVSAPRTRASIDKKKSPKVNIKHNKYTKKVSTRVVSKGKKVKRDTERKVDNLIEGSIDSLFR